ncbi:MAG: isoprenylcysteine carboxylmethyltransferase family protein [Saprospiraceae bacterium]
MINSLDVIWNFSLILLFGIQHSIMARDWFKKWWKNVIPATVERVTYLLFSSIVLGIIILFWQPINIVIWDLQGSSIAVFITGLSILGLVIIAISVLSLSAADFSGWQQVRASNDNYESIFQTPLLYKFVRHPIYFGFLISFWATPYLTLGHLFFAFLMSAYIYIGAVLEERNLVERFGIEYRIYQQEVAMLIPFFKFPF